MATAVTAFVLDDDDRALLLAIIDSWAAVAHTRALQVHGLDPDTARRLARARRIAHRIRYPTLTTEWY
jgi:hypothetical protein